MAILSESGSSDASVEPAVMHLVVFKCIEAHKEFHYQEILALVVKKIKQGEPVPVTCRVQKEPSNPVDSRAIAFECRVNDQCERIGYVLHVHLTIFSTLTTGSFNVVCQTLITSSPHWCIFACTLQWKILQLDYRLVSPTSHVCSIRGLTQCITTFNPPLLGQTRRLYDRICLMLFGSIFRE